jgi:hypothetical protein
MPPKVVKTICDLIFWQYAKLIARAAGFADNWGFMVKTFKDLQTGKKSWSDVLREDRKMQGEQRCVYCGSTGELTWDHIIPQKVNAPKDCKVNEIHNLVPCCKKCNSSKGARDVFAWYVVDRPDDELPRIVEGKYLKLIYECHECRGTLHDPADLNLDGEINVRDLGWIFTEPCPPHRGGGLR